MAKESGITVYEVLADIDGDGPACDGTKVFRFRKSEDALMFAAKSTCYGHAAKVSACDNVPRHIAQRWGMC